MSAVGCRPPLATIGGRLKLIAMVKHGMNGKPILPSCTWRSAGHRALSPKALAIATMIILVSLFLAVQVPRKASAYTSHASIYISGNGDFTTGNGVTGGSGLPSDPYIIESWEIDAAPQSYAGIWILNADAYFVIRHVYIRLPVAGDSECIRIENSANFTIARSTLFCPEGGMRLEAVTNVVIEANDIPWSGLDGIMVGSGVNVTIAANTIESNWWAGIRVLLGTNVTVTANNITSNRDEGIVFYSVPGGLIVNNRIAENGDAGVFLSQSSGARVFHNDFVGNHVQARDGPRGWGVNYWDDGYPSGGNYWSDYTGTDNCSGPSQNTCPDPDGIGDIAYPVGDNQDRYPRMSPYIVPTVSIVAPADHVVVQQSLVNVTGTASIATLVRVRTDGGGWQNASGTSTWWLTVGPLDDGNHTIEAQAFNRTASSTVESVTIRVAVPAPTLTVIAPLESQDIRGTFVLSGNAASGAAVESRVDGGVWSALSVAAEDGTWSFSWDTRQFADGQHVLDFRAVKDNRESVVITRHVAIDNAGGSSTGGVVVGAMVAAPLVTATILSIVVVVFWLRRRASASHTAREQERANRRPRRQA